MVGLAVSPAYAQDLIFQQTWDTLAYYDSTLTPFSNREVADDFDLEAEITRITAGGTSVTPDGAFVRFFAGTPNGPGALLAEYYLDGGDPGLIVTGSDAARLDITLPEPFVASGHTYVSVQPVADGSWFWWNADFSSISGTTGYTRTDGGSWSTVLDVCFSLYGTLLGAGQIDSLGEATLPRSGFLEIFGSGLGSEGEVLVGGHPAITASWEDGRIAAYVPEAAGPGIVPVQVVHEGGASNTLDLEVTLREASGRQLWRLRMDTLYSQVRPVVGPDGTIYAVDVYDRLYAVSPDGALLWLVEQAGSKGVDVDAAGIIYTGNEDWIKAFNPDGTLRWTFDQNPRAFVLPDVAVGPDGNVYALASSGLGVFSLTPDGVLRWATPEPYDRLFVGYTEIVFGPGPDGRDQLYFSANSHTRAIRLEDGAEIFTIGTTGNPAVSPVDGTLHSAYVAYLPDGNLAWQFHEFLNGTPAIGPSGIHYSTTSMVTARVYAVNIDGSERWSATTGESTYYVDVDPTESRLLLGTSGVLTSAPALLGVDTDDGAVLWRSELQVEDPHIPNPWTGGMGFHQFIDSRAAFQSDGSAAYSMTAIAPGGATTDRAFLYAFDIGPDTPPPSGLLRSTRIDLRGRARGGTARLLGRIQVDDENGAPVAGAEVTVSWSLPDGGTEVQTATTTGSGQARIQMNGGSGTYVVTIVDIAKPGFAFDPDNSVLTKSITM
jgi:hypothetical protein